MLSKLSDALDLYLRQLGLIVAIVLTVWIPGNLVLSAMYVYGDSDGGLFRASMIVGGLLDPLCAAAVIGALWRLERGESVSWGRALRLGWRDWGAVFWTRLNAGILIGLGLVAFLVPGIVLALRWTLLDFVVVAERAGPQEARQRSKALMSGLYGTVIALMLGVYSLLGVAMVGFGLGIELFIEQFGRNLPLELGYDLATSCLLDILLTFETVVLFVLYRDRRVDEGLVLVDTPAPAASMAVAGDTSSDNPFEPPH